MRARGRKVKSRDCALASDLVRAVSLSVMTRAKSIAYNFPRYESTTYFFKLIPNDVG